MELQNKRVFFLGDSITEGVGASSEETCYVSVFAKTTGADVKNYGISGTRIAKQRKKSANPQFDRDFLSRVDEMDSDADIIVVFGGTNDFGHGDSTVGDFESQDEYTFYGALHSLCQKLIKKYPNSEIVFLTPLHRLGEDAEINEIGIPNERPLSGYVDAIKEVAGYYGLPVLDLFHMSGIQPNVEIIREKFMPDGLHPSDAGAEKLAKRIRAFLLSL
ncbi:MAG: SGNH/GDSL hydrolase family protein [Firmicutes bacterium]|nr:SGNH/GDSL hydrolase family protein [Bacillota bacterium]